MAERVGFEPTVPVKVHLISNQARSTGLRHLSAGGHPSKNRRFWGRPEGGQRENCDSGAISRSLACVLASPLLKNRQAPVDPPEGHIPFGT